VRYIAQPISVPVLAALYRAADVMLVTSLRDGMNLVAKEFVSARSDEDGVLILSEMAGAAEELFDALMVNPYSIDQLAGAMARALALDRDERRHRMRCMRQRVNDWTVERWVREFTFDVDGAATPVESTVERLAGTIRALVPEGLAAAREGLAAARGRTRGGRMLAGAAVHRLRQATN
jgi:trehalose 6-phosphate synthase/phosphatase